MQKKYSNIITDFLKSHPLISIQNLENALALPGTTIAQALNASRLIPVKHIYSIIGYLAAYGLKIDGYTLSYDESDGVLTGRKWIENVEEIEEDGCFTYIIKEYRMLATDYFDLL